MNNGETIDMYIDRQKSYVQKLKDCSYYQYDCFFDCNEADELYNYITTLQNETKESCQTYQKALDETMSQKTDYESMLYRINSYFTSLEYSAPENQYVFMKEIRGVLDEFNKINRA